MIGPDQIARMKDGVRLVNVARGGIIQEAALREGLESGKIAGAAVDVWETEPTPPDNPLLKAPTLVGTPHLGASTERRRSAWPWTSPSRSWTCWKGGPPAPP
jgi:phosphoglycerate dehydrogenase-like enzyme